MVTLNLKMDGHKFNSKLRQTFKVLFLDNKSPHDDTLLEKFTSLLETKLHENNENSRLLIDSLNNVPWMDFFLVHWKTLDTSIAAFGLNILGLAISNPTWKNLVFKTHGSCLQTCIQELIKDFSNLPALLRFSTLKLLHRLTESKSCIVPPTSDIPDLPMKSLTDDSIFVARAAKELVSYLLIDAFQRVDSESDEFTKTTDHLSECIREANEGLKAKKRALIVVHLLIEVCEKCPQISAHLNSSTQLQSIIKEIIEDSQDEDVCSSCCHLLLLIMRYEMSNGIPHEWLEVTDILLKSHKVISMAKFVILTCERASCNNTNIPQILKSMLLRPLILCSRWQSSQNLAFINENLGNWDKTLNILLADNNQCILSKLNGCILANVSKLHSCFQSSTERLALLELLLFVLSDYNKYASYSIKLQNITADCLIELLTNWENHWFEQLSATEHSTLLDKGCIALGKYITPPSLMVKVMKIVQILLKTCHFHRISSWNTVAEILQKRCHDLQWEIRDSAFEMLAEITKLAKEQNFLHQWLADSGALNLVVAALDDNEGYVRASALSVFENSPEIICQEQEISIVDKVIKIKPLEIILRTFLQDSEGIVRRAAITALLTCYKEAYIITTDLGHLYKSMANASMDLDWEVKLAAIDFWEAVLTATFFGKRSDMTFLESLRETGFYEAAISLVEDEDVTVQHRMASLVKRLKESFNFSQAVASDNDTEEIQTEMLVLDGPEQMEAASSEESKLLAIEQVLDTRDCVTVENVMVTSELSLKSHWLADDRLPLGEILALHRHSRAAIAFPEFVKWLTLVNVEELLRQSDVTTDLYSANPESLLDDILLDNYESDNEGEIAMDCY